MPAYMWTLCTNGFTLATDKTTVDCDLKCQNPKSHYISLNTHIIPGTLAPIFPFVLFFSGDGGEVYKKQLFYSKRQVKSRLWSGRGEAIEAKGG